MRASSGASRGVCASTGACARAAAWRGFLIAGWMSALVLAGTARADDPPPRPPAPPAPARAPAAPSGDARRDGPFEIRLWLENDNLLLGNYGRMVGHGHDGNDLGRTHASGIRLGYDLGDRVLLELDAESALFTRSTNGVEPGRMMVVPIFFHELSRFRLGVGLDRPGGPWRIRWGIGLDVSNREEVVAIGASGQQNFWHRFLRYTLNTGTWVYEYHPDGAGIRVGAATDARAGGTTHYELASWSWLEAEGDLGARLGSLPGASWIEAQGRVAAGIGARRGVRLLVSLEQRAYVWLEEPGVMLRSTIDARLDFELLAVQVAVHRYDGDQNELYFVYVFENTTMTVGLWARF